MATPPTDSPLLTDISMYADAPLPTDISMYANAPLPTVKAAPRTDNVPLSIHDVFTGARLHQAKDRVAAMREGKVSELSFDDDMLDHALFEEFTCKVGELAVYIPESAMCAEIAVASLNGTKERLFRVAARNSLLMLRTLVAAYDHMPMDVTFWAANSGRCDILRFAAERGAPWHPWTTSEAAKGGHLACLQLAHALGHNWDQWALTETARHGHLECMQFLHKHGATWCAEVTALAAKGAHKACMEYAAAHGCPDSMDANYKQSYRSLSGSLAASRALNVLDANNVAMPGYDAVEPSPDAAEPSLDAAEPSHDAADHDMPDLTT
jgi:hypothetical protein